MTNHHFFYISSLWRVNGRLYFTCIVREKRINSNDTLFTNSAYLPYFGVALIINPRPTCVARVTVLSPGMQTSTRPPARGEYATHGSKVRSSRMRTM